MYERQAGAKTDTTTVTPEMIEAGKNEIMSYWSELAAAPTNELYKEVAISIYLAMHQFRLRSIASTDRT
jgi:hypothetical protein